MAQFRRGGKQVVKDRSCENCRNGRHLHCIALVAEIGFGMRDWGDDEPEFRSDFAGLNCECYRLDEAGKKH